jgi:hypothetical protein
MGNNIMTYIPRGVVESIATYTVEEHTSDYQILENQSGITFSNRRATGPITLTLPALANKGRKFTFVVQSAQELRIDPGVQTIRDDEGNVAGKYLYNDFVGLNITLIADSNHDWATSDKIGNQWSSEA